MKKIICAFGLLTLMSCGIGMDSKQGVDSLSVEEVVVDSLIEVVDSAAVDSVIAVVAE